MSNLLLSALGVVCPACDHHNPPRSAQCVGCGTPLLAASSPAKPAPTAGARPAPSTSPGGMPSSPPVVPAATLGTPRPPSAVPPGMRPAAPPKPGVPPMLSPAPLAAPAPLGAEAPIPASELIKRPAARPPPAAPAPVAPASTMAAAPKFGVAVVAGPSKGQRYRLPAAGAQVGRAKGAILFPEDPSVSAHHATFVVRDAQLFVRDESSASGVLVSVSGQQAIAPNTFFSAGAHLFKYAGSIGPGAHAAPGRAVPYGAPVAPGQPIYLIEEILLGGRPGRAVTTTGPLFTVGQGKCDFSLPPEEGLAPRHCELTPSPTGAMLKDLSGGLGTFVRIAAGMERPLQAGDRLRIGQQVLQVEALG